jgi:hypothetical protein
MEMANKMGIIILGRSFTEHYTGRLTYFTLEHHRRVHFFVFYL